MNCFIQQYGISQTLGAKIYQQYKQDMYRILKENPYKMAEDISGVGFKIADEIAARIGIHTDSDYRIRSGLLYILLLATAEGHVYLPKKGFCWQEQKSFWVFRLIIWEKTYCRFGY